MIESHIRHQLEIERYFQQGSLNQCDCFIEKLNTVHTLSQTIGEEVILMTIMITQSVKHNMYKVPKSSAVYFNGN